MSFVWAKYSSSITFAIFISEFCTPFFSFLRRALSSLLLFVVGFNPANISWNFNFISRSSCVSSIPSRLALFCLLAFSITIVCRWSISGPGIASIWFTWFTASIWSSCLGIAAAWFALFTSHFGLAFPIGSIVLCPYWLLQRCISGTTLLPVSQGISHPIFPSFVS